MFPLWEDVIAPVIDAVGARRVIEIGALRGETTTRMLKRLGAECELHVIDPVPQFDPAEHERAFPGRYHFHLGTSHDVLPELPPADVALIDGDHNWYTVFHELRILADTARRAATHLPVLILHDVSWPYGRRDLYYAPERIPEADRQPYAEGGMRPGTSQLAASGGMNLGMHNAVREGGPRNGVRTALDDFAAVHTAPLRVVVLPVYYGLAIAAEEAVLAEHPELAARLDRYETLEGQHDLVDLGEHIRLGEAMFGQAWIRMLEDQVGRTADRYLEVVKAALLDEHYLDNELRVSYLLHGGSDAAALRDPPRSMVLRYERLAKARHAGLAIPNAEGGLAYTTMGRAQLDHLATSVREVLDDGVDGDLMEIGVGGGGGAMLLRAALAAAEVTDRDVWVLDAFVPEGRLGSDLNRVRDGFARFGLLDDTVRFVQGQPTSMLADLDERRLAMVRIGLGSAAEVTAVLDEVIPRMTPTGRLVVAGTSNEAIGEAVAEARLRHRVETPLERIDWNAVTWRQPDRPAPTLARPPARPIGSSQGARLALPVTSDRVDLSVVVVFHNMRREAARTLASLTRSYQRDIEDLRYEVLAIDNGSSAEQALTADEVAGYGPEFRLLELPDPPHASPVGALNAGVAASRGDAIALMIDGAHLLTPRVLHFGVTALRTFEPAVVATQQWYVGPGQQGDAQHAGYDQRVEDRLFDGIQWPADGYRLFEIGHFIGDRDWFDGIVESNCLFVPRGLLERIGGFDERFATPGGGYANLDLFERLSLEPGVTAASILGEGSFHQFHGGTTTNVADEAERRDRVVSYREDFEALRGRRLAGLDRPIHFVGTLTSKAARRTRSRREISLSFDALREPTAVPTPPVPVPDELKLAAIEAVWDHQAWRAATWLGHPVNRYPADLHVLQELLVEVRPGLVVLAGDDAGLGGRALHAATVCDELGAGLVVAVGRSPVAGRPAHPRVTHLEGAAELPDVAARVHDVAPPEPNAVVVLGLGEVTRVIGAFEHYAPLVDVGGYVVIENTVVNGRPAASGFGAGPHEAAVALLGLHGDFVPDPHRERYTITFNRSGYLKRVAPR